MAPAPGGADASSGAGITAWETPGTVAANVCRFGCVATAEPHRRLRPKGGQTRSATPSVPHLRIVLRHTVLLGSCNDATVRHGGTATRRSPRHGRAESAAAGVGRSMQFPGPLAGGRNFHPVFVSSGQRRRAGADVGNGPWRAGSIVGRMLVLFVIVVAVVLFSVGNDEPIRLVFLGFTSPSVGLALVTLAAVLVGALGTMAVVWPAAMRSQHHLEGLERELTVARKGLSDSHLASLKHLPSAPAEAPDMTDSDDV